MTARIGGISGFLVGRLGRRSPVQQRAAGSGQQRRQRQVGEQTQQQFFMELFDDFADSSLARWRKFKREFGLRARG